jgi:hypothetical protein
MKKVTQPRFPMFSCFTLPTATLCPFAQPQNTRKTGCILTIFNKTRDLEFVRAKSLFRPPVSFEKNGVFARTLPMDTSNSANSYWEKSRRAEKSR